MPFSARLRSDEGDAPLLNFRHIDTGWQGLASGSAASFTRAFGSLIEGWVQGIPGMKVGGKRTLLI